MSKSTSATVSVTSHVLTINSLRANLIAYSLPYPQPVKLLLYPSYGTCDFLRHALHRVVVTEKYIMCKKDSLNSSGIRAISLPNIWLTEFLNIESRGACDFPLSNVCHGKL